MTSIEELNTAREKLFEGLGEKAKLYFHLMKMWFHMKCTKEKFDFEVRKFMDVKQARLHNQFLLQLLLHCSKPDLPTSSQSYSRLKDKRRKVNNNGGFQQTNVQEFAPTRITQRPPDEPPRYCVQELLLPDYEMILKRLTVGAWELGLKGAERGAAEILEVAVKHFLKNIISTVLSRRNGFRVRDGSVQHAVGIPVSNPWLKNTAGILSSKNVGPVTEDMDTRENMPISRPSFTEQQQDIAVTYAASVSPARKRPITAIECYEALQIYRKAVPSHGVYSINMERLSAQMSHPSWDEIDNN